MRKGVRHNAWVSWSWFAPGIGIWNNSNLEPVRETDRGESI